MRFNFDNEIYYLQKVDSYSDNEHWCVCANTIMGFTTAKSGNYYYFGLGEYLCKEENAFETFEEANAECLKRNNGISYDD